MRGEATVPLQLEEDSVLCVFSSTQVLFETEAPSVQGLVEIEWNRWMQRGEESTPAEKGKEA